MIRNDNKNRRNTRKRKKRRISIFRVIILIVLLIGFIGTGAVAGAFLGTITSIKSVDPSKIYTLLDENSCILDKNGNMIEKIQSDGVRTIVEYDEIPDHVKNAFIAIEDQNFFNHNGISFKRIVKALIEDIKAGAPVQGASTITQQLAKNLYLSHDKKIERKIKEVYYAFKLERYLTKEQILEAYLNTAYLGAGAKGVQAAANAYFSKDIKDLDLAESALLACITKNPSRYSPLKTLEKDNVDPNKHYIVKDNDEIYTIVYDDRYKERYKLVLSLMKEQNMISDEEYYQAMQEDLKTHLKPGKLESYEISSFFVDKVKSDVVEALMKELNKTEEEALNMLYNGGLKIYSTLDIEMQKKLEKAYQNPNNFPNLVAKKDSSGNIIGANKKILLYKYNNIINSNGQLIIPRGEFKYDSYGNLILYKNRRLNFDPLYENNKIKNIRVAIKDSYIQHSSKGVMALKGGPINIPSEYKRYDRDKNLIISKKFLSSQSSFLSKDKNGNLLIGKDYYFISEKGAMQPQSASVIMDYRTGEIKALVGGREVVGKKLYNRAIQPRQPGSAIKPISVYTPAIDNGWTAADVVDDVPHYDHKGNLWPKNSYSGYRGLSTIREAIQHSINVVAVKVVEKIGPQTSIDYLKKMGITTIRESGISNDKNSAAMGLGGMTKGISPLELTAAYGCLANEGVYIKPKSFVKITDRNDNVLLENTGYKNRVVNSDVAFIMTDMLRDVITSGTGRSANLGGGIHAAGKTGTTSNNYDAWFVGYTPYYVCGVWIGNDVQIQLSSGSGVSAKLWKTIMSSIHQGLPQKSFTKPENIISVAVDTKSGKLPTSLSYRDPRGTVRSEYFVKGTEPKSHDNVHVQVKVDTSTNKRANSYCPSRLVAWRVFVQRPIPYSPSKNGGIVPRDYAYEAPGYCGIHNKMNIGSPPTDKQDEQQDDEQQEDDEINPLSPSEEDEKAPNKKPKKNNGESNENIDMEAPMQKEKIKNIDE